MQRYVLRNESVRERVRSMLDRLPVNDEQPLEVVVQPHRPKRSNPQNDRLWEINSQVAADLSVRTQCKWSSEDVHEVIFKPRFCGMRELTTPSGRTVKRARSSTDLSKTEMADAQEKYVAWCIGQGIDLELMDG